jgi:hypothetical protein
MSDVEPGGVQKLNAAKAAQRSVLIPTLTVAFLPQVLIGGTVGGVMLMTVVAVMAKTHNPLLPVLPVVAVVGLFWVAARVRAKRRRVRAVQLDGLRYLQRKAGL